MTYRLLRDESVEEAVGRIAREQLREALRDFGDEQLDDAEIVHQVRKRCKKVRGLLRMVRQALGDTYARENAWYRDAARSISGLRDATALLEAFDALIDRYEDQVNVQSFAPLRQALAERRHELETALDLSEKMAAFRSAIKQGKKRVKTWRLSQRGFKAVAGGIGVTYRRARRGMSRARGEPSVANLHEWRKRVKYHWYHMRLLRPVWPALYQVRRGAAKNLSDLLGDDHDLHMLAQTLVSEPQRFGDAAAQAPVLALIDLRRRELQAAAGAIGTRLFADKTRNWVRQQKRYWKAWRTGHAVNKPLPHEVMELGVGAMSVQR